MKFSEILNDTRRLTRLVWLVFATLVGVALAFGAYYYWDRYAHPGDRSPVEMGIQGLEDAVRADPTAAAPRLALAEHYLSIGRYKDALEQASQVLEAYPENDQAVFITGMAQVLSNDLEAGIASLEQFAGVRRQSPMAATDMTLEVALYYLGESYLKVDQPDKAAAALAEAVMISPTDADALYQLGVAHLETQQYDLALASLDRAVQFVPDFAEAYQAMAECYKATGDAARQEYALGMIAFSRKDFAGAAARLEKVTAALPDFAPAFLGLGLAQEALGDLQAARASLERAAALNPDDFMTSNALQRVAQSQTP